MATIANINNTSQLGNQLFVLAACYAQSRRMNEPCWLPSNWQYAHVFKMVTEFVSLRTHRPSRPYKHQDFVYKPVPNAPNLCFASGGTTRETAGDYYQCERYFEGYESEIQQMFKLPNRTYNDGVALHIRGKDYLNLSHFYNIITADYYQRALDQLGATKCDVFTDDPKHAQKVLAGVKGVQLTFKQSPNNIVDLTAIGGYRNFICSNSTFGWWAAYLGWRDGNTVIWPSRYFVQKEWLGAEKDIASKLFTVIPA